ncbi:MAG: Minf_1886 family protein [Phycisphaeraceae bacterium]
MELHSIARKTKYPLDAFAFVQRGLDFTVRRLHGEQTTEPREGDESRHVSGQELCQGLRDFALGQYGLMARSVLRRWGITTCEDFGRIVFAMVDAQLMRKTEGDTINDFASVFDFAQAFSRDLVLSDTTGE